MDTERITCMFPVETLARELDAKLYLGIRCIEKGLGGFVLGRKSSVVSEAFSGKYNYIIFDKGISRDIDRFNAIKRSGGVSVLLDEEGGVYSEGGVEYGLRGGTSNVLLSEYKRIFYWSEEIKTMFLSKNKINDNSSFCVSGHPRFDLSKKKFNEYFNLVSKITKPKKTYIQINTLFAGYNGFLTLEEELALLKGHPDYEKFEIFYHKAWDENKKGLSHYIDMAIALAKKFPEIIFIFRPHPGETIDVYLSAFDGIDNIVVSKEGSSKEWEADALLLIHPGCTTSIEAMINGKDPIFYFPDNDPYFIPTIPRDISKKANTVDDLESLIKRKQEFPDCSLFSDEELAENKKMISTIIANVDFDSADRIADELCLLVGQTVFNDPENLLIAKSFLKVLKERIFSVIPDNFRKYVKTITQKNNMEYLRYMDKFPKLPIIEVQKRIEAFSAVIPGMSEMKIVELSKDTFYITKCN